MRTTARPLVFTLVLALAAAGAAPPRAWAEPASKDDRVLAREHFKRGEAHQSLGQYDLAIAEYLAGYDRAPRPQFLFNIAQCYRLKGDKVTAVGYYRRYVAADPNGKGAAEAQQHLGELERELAEQSASDTAKPAPEPVAPPAPAPELGATAPAPTTVPAPRPLVAPTDVPARAPPTRRERAYKITGLAAMGTGVVAAVVGVGYTVKMEGLENRVEKPDDNTYNDRVDSDARRAAKISYVFYGVGGGLAVTGAVLYWLGGRERAEPRSGRAMTLSPLVGPGMAGVSASGCF